MPDENPSATELLQEAGQLLHDSTESTDPQEALLFATQALAVATMATARATLTVARRPS